MRTYKRKLGSRIHRNYTKENLKVAASQVKGGHITLREAQDIFGIPKSTLSRFIKKKHLKSYGGQSALSAKEESSLVEVLILAAEWGFPLEKFDIRTMVKSYLERLGVRHKIFKNNLPGKDWVDSFLKRHTDRLTVRLSENIKRARAETNDKVINEYFDNLSITLENVPAENVINYDETNFVDDPGRPRVIVRRQTKHPERIVDSSKSAVSVMFSATGDGTLLPPFIVYKSEHLYGSWLENGPKGARYARSKHGWFDQAIFEEWFSTLVLPYLKKKWEKSNDRRQLSQPYFL